MYTPIDVNLLLGSDRLWRTGVRYPRVLLATRLPRQPTGHSRKLEASEAAASSTHGGFGKGLERVRSALFLSVCSN
jgi:hypothetical protein